MEGNFFLDSQICSGYKLHIWSILRQVFYENCFKFYFFLRQTISYRIGLIGGSDWSKDEEKGVSTIAFAVLRNLAGKFVIYARSKILLREDMKSRTCFSDIPSVVWISVI